MARPLPGLRRVEHAGRGGARAGAAPRRGGGGAPRRARAVRPVRLADVEAVKVARLQTGIGELDRVLGGGLVPGSLVLLGGSPGIGKSTLTSMALGNLAGAGRRTLYVSGEESRGADQAARRAAARARRSRCPVLAETDLDTVLATLEAERPEVCVIDSVQTLHAAELTGAAGLRRPGARGRRPDHAAGQGARHRRAARRPRHQGGRARGPARARAPRRLRAAVRGRARAHLPHAARAQEPLRLDQRGRRVRDAPGRAGRGRRTRAPASSARPRARPAASCWRRWRARGRCSSRSRRSCRRPSWCRRGASPTGSTATGSRSCSPCSARHAGVGVGSADVFVNVAGGVRVDEPGADLAVALAVASAARGVVAGAGERPIACFGEIGLTGELRSVAHPERRLAEAREVRARAGRRAGRGRSRRDRGGHPAAGAEGRPGAPRRERPRGLSRVARSNRLTTPVFRSTEPNIGLNDE